MTKTCLAAALAFFGTALILNAEAQEKKPASPLQHEIVVTAARVGAPARESAGSFTVITADDLERSKKTTVLEILEAVLGVTVVQAGGKGSAASAFLRGANSEHTMVLMDGVELNDSINPSRSFDLAHLPLESVERIEVLRGPQSTLYGSDAIGGLVNIVTRRGGGKPRPALSSSAGSWGTVASSAALAGSAKAWNYSFGLSQFRTNGISAAGASYPGNKEKDGDRRFSLTTRLGFSPSANWDFDIIARAIDAKTDIDNFGGPFGDDVNNVQSYRSVFIKAGARALLSGNRWEQKLGISFVGSDRKHDNPRDPGHPFDWEKGRYRGGLFKVDWQNNVFLHPANTLTFGAEWEEERGESEYDSGNAWGDYTSPFPVRSARTLGLYLQDGVRFGGRFFATAGLRLDGHSRSGWAFTWRIAPAYLIERTDTKIKAAASTGFKSPSLYQLYAPGTWWGPIGNEGLEPEKSLSWEAGIEQALAGGRVLLQAVYFHNDFKNLINFEYNLGYVNIGRAESQGVEISAEGRLSGEFKWRAAATRTKSRDKKSGLALVRRPENQVTAAFDWKPLSKWTLDVSFIHVGSREDMDYASWPGTRVTLPAYGLLNATVSFDLSPSFQLFGRFDNLLAAHYETIKGYGAPGRAIYGGIRLGH